MEKKMADLGLGLGEEDEKLDMLGSNSKYITQQKGIRVYDGDVDFGMNTNVWFQRK